MFRALTNVTVAGTLALLAAGCATPPSDPAALAEYNRINDPLEPTNRYVFEVNRLFDFLVFRPIADTYRTVIPEYGQERVSRVVSNMGEPITAVNTLLQGRVDDTGTTIARFLINSTLGIGGLFDVASEFGLPDKDADFGQTLYTYGVVPGPYLVLPIFGPSNFRDGIGQGVDTFADPVGIAFSIGDVDGAGMARAGASGVSQRARAIEPLDNLERTSIDFYAQLRSIVQQRREAELRGEKVQELNYDIYKLD